MFLSVLIIGEPDTDEDDDYVRRVATSLAQDLAYAVKIRKSLTPKHLVLGLAIHQATR